MPGTSPVLISVSNRSWLAAGHCRLPSFDHNVKDPVEDDIEVLEHHRVVIVEGNYLHLGVCPLLFPPLSDPDAHRLLI